jgi:hypothetical protein
VIQVIKAVHVGTPGGFRLRIRFADEMEGNTDPRRLVHPGVFRIGHEPGGFDRVDIEPRGRCASRDFGTRQE